MKHSIYHDMIIQKVLRDIPRDTYSNDYPEVIEEAIVTMLSSYHQKCIRKITSTVVNRDDFDSIAEYHVGRESLKILVEKIKTTSICKRLFNPDNTQFPKCNINPFLFEYYDMFDEMRNEMTSIRKRREGTSIDIHYLHDDFTNVYNSSKELSARYRKEYKELYDPYMKTLPLISLLSLELSDELRTYLVIGLNMKTLKELIMKSRNGIYDPKFKEELDHFFKTYVGLPVSYRYQ